MLAGNGGGMTTTTLVILNLALSLLTVAAVAALVRLAHRLPSTAPRADAGWGEGSDRLVPSDPLPLVQIARHERERELGAAA